MNVRIPEGEIVSFIGEPIHDTPVEIGDMGRVLSAADSASHVQWRTGSMQGQITLMANSDLVIMHPEYDGSSDSLDAPIVTISARDVYDRSGPTGLLNALHVEGHLKFFEPLVQEAIERIASSIRDDPSFRPILAELGREEGDQLVSLATSTLLRDAFGEL